MSSLLASCSSFRSILKASRFMPLMITNTQLALFKNQMSTTKNGESEGNDLIREASIPNETWTEKTKKLYNELMELCNDGKWEKIVSFQNFTRNERLFLRAIEEKGKMFEYAMFLNREEQKIRAVVQFGPWLQGPKGAVHGGAIATMFDSVGGVLSYNLGYRCATVNLNVNFHGFLPLYTTAECTAWVTKKEGRKIFVESELKSIDGKTVFDRCTALWLQMGSSEEETEKEFVPLLETAIIEGCISKIEGRKLFVEAQLKSTDGKTVYDTCNMLWILIDENIVEQKNLPFKSKY